MKKVVRLTESDLTRIVKRVIEESNELNEIGDYDMSIINRVGGKILDSVTKNGYELSLVDFGPAGKTISLTYDNKGYFQPNQQKKQPSEYKGKDMVKILRGFKSVVEDWVNEYGEIQVGSTNETRVNYYHKWLCSSLNCSTLKTMGQLPHGEVQYGFSIKN